MINSEYLRWGTLLDVLSQMSDMEYQLIAQVDEPQVFIPDDLLFRWNDTFRGGRGLARTGVGEHMIALLLDFDMHLEDLIEYLPEEAENPVDYIRHDEVWRAVREMADWTLSRVAEITVPEEPFRSLN